ncbi:MAG: T9SS type A sorting domain-containing protein [Saprospiraceae bacterium]|nr:T9SS type A sorting domain-containing protein [Saprospiraceae bacterium]
MFTLRPAGTVMLWMLLLWLQSSTAIAQTCGPDCRALNLSITSSDDSEFHSKVMWSDLIPNFACAAPISYELTTLGGASVAKGSSDDVGNQVYLIIDDPCRFLRDGLMVIISNNQGSCMNLLTFKKGMLNFKGRHMDVSCLDPRVSAPVEEDLPNPIMACDGLITPRWVADWPVLYDCVAGIQDTAKVIYREWEAFDKDGIRYSSFDTLVVHRLPQLDAAHFYCPDRDTLYCGTADLFGPYWLIENPISGDCDTVPFIDADYDNGELYFSALTFDKTCGLQLHLDTTKFANGCEEIWKIDLEVKQDCAGLPNLAECTVPAMNQATPLDNAGAYWRCTFWLYNIDTLAPEVRCDYSHFGDQSILEPRSELNVGSSHCYQTPASPVDDTNVPVVLISTSTHDCAALTAIPGLCINEDWSGIGQVKASIEGIGAFVLNYVDTCADGSSRYEFDGVVELPLLEEPYQITYEVYDGCHSMTTVYCYILVKDATKPIAVADKGVTVSLGGKIAWVNATDFDEGSSDNCAVNLLLARRSDWSTAGVDLCDEMDSICLYHGEYLMLPELETDKKINEIEAHYAQTIKWFEEDGGPCSDVLLNSWKFGLIEAAYRNCQDGHLTREDLVRIFENECHLDLNGTSEHFGCMAVNDYEKLLTQAAEIGGGWSAQVPFTCEDACQEVTVEILVMDYWCNWSRNWTLVQVEDRTPVSIIQDVEDEIDITCNTYKIERYAFGGQTVNLDYLVDMGIAGEDDALQALDDIFGGYEKIWIDGQGKWIDGDGQEISTSIDFHDSICYCEEVREQVSVYDDHLGMIWVDSVYSICGYKNETKTFRKGVVAVNCAQNVQCRQTIWKDIDHCGEGSIYRKFQIWGGCPVDKAEHTVDTLTRIQKISVFNNCTLSKAMFDVPGDVEIYSCGIEYDPLGSGLVVGAADPSMTGSPVYRFDDDCRIIGVAHEDKVFKIVGGDAACYKIIRTWYFADWCVNDGQPSDGWWYQGDLISDTCVQKIIVIDTVPPVCLITGPVEAGGVISAAGCDYDFFADVDVMDECGVIDYTYQIFANQVVVANGFGQLATEVQDHFTISAANLSDGDYTLRVRTTDQCQNEGFCDYPFTIETSKKPSPVCITTLTVELTPDDSDNDGVTDTATALIWAEEFNVSSQAPCGTSDADLKFYIERITGDDAETLDTTVDKSYLSLGCNDIGTQNVRMWVLSPTGTADFCDVYLKVQNNAEGCSLPEPVFSNLDGSINTTDGLGVNDVTVAAKIQDVVVESPRTDRSGLYAMLFGLGEEVLLTPGKDGDDLNGVTTADLLALANLISNTSPISNPYVRISCDVNFDGVINAFDILGLRNLILHNVSEFPDGPSWRFVTKDYNFTTALPESEDFPETMDLLLTEQEMHADFMAMKIGDLDLDRSTESSGRSRDALIMKIEEKSFVQNEKVMLSPVFESAVDLVGLQFELHFDPHRLKYEGNEVEGKLALKDENLGIKYIDEGIIYCSWIKEDGINLSTDEVLFNFVFTAQDQGTLSESVSLVGNRLNAEGYTDLNTHRPVALNFVGDVHEMEVGQNIPNPFQEQTVVPVVLSRPQVLSLIITDVHGKVVYQERKQGVVGRQEFEISRDHFLTPGIYYYSVLTDDEKVTKKMILLR